MQSESIWPKKALPYWARIAVTLCVIVTVPLTFTAAAIYGGCKFMRHLDSELRKFMETGR